MTRPRLAEHPISFPNEMVKAILNGKKTEARFPILGDLSFCRMSGDNEPCWVWWPKSVKKTATCPPLPIERWIEYCSYGILGDKLWVRETVAYRSDIDAKATLGRALHYTAYKADDTSFNPKDQMNWHDYGKSWVPSSRMPRWASRITLEIVSVRVERLQEISDLDIAAEGLDVQFHEGQCATASVHLPKKTSYSTARGCFALFWDSMNAKRGVQFRWDANPWVWVIGFRKLESCAKQK